MLEREEAAALAEMGDIYMYIYIYVYIHIYIYDVYNVYYVYYVYLNVMGPRMQGWWRRCWSGRRRRLLIFCFFFITLKPRVE